MDEGPYFAREVAVILRSAHRQFGSMMLADRVASLFCDRLFQTFEVWMRRERSFLAM